MPTFDTPEPIVAAIECGAGHVRISASERADTVVEVHPTDEAQDADVRAAQQARVEYANGQLSVTTPKKQRLLFGRPASVEVVVALPSGSKVEAKVWANVHSEGRLGESSFETAVGSLRLDQTGPLKARTHAGGVSVTRSVGDTDVSTSSGKIRIGEVHGTAVVKTANGDITVGEVTGEAQLNTAHGDITVERAPATVSARTAYGNVRIGEAVRGTVVLETGFGDLELGVGDGTAAWLDAKSRFGTVRSHLEDADEPKPSDETVEVRARTGYGDIMIRRSAAAL